MNAFALTVTSLLGHLLHGPFFHDPTPERVNGIRPVAPKYYPNDGEWCSWAAAIMGTRSSARPPVTVRTAVFRAMWATDLAFSAKPITLTCIRCPRTLNSFDLSTNKRLTSNTPHLAN